MEIPTPLTMRIILCIDNRVNYGGALTRKLKVTSSAVIKILHNLKDLGIIKIKRSGKTKKIITFTKNGEKLRFLLEEIQEL